MAPRRASRVWRHEHRRASAPGSSAVLPRVRQDLEDLVRIESVSADPEPGPARCERSAEAVGRAVRGRGLRRVEIVRATTAAPRR